MKKKDNFSRLQDMYADVSIQCKCGHKEVMPIWINKKLCSWCGNYIYRYKKDEFKEKLLKQLKEI